MEYISSHQVLNDNIQLYLITKTLVRKYDPISLVIKHKF